MADDGDLVRESLRNQFALLHSCEEKDARIAELEEVVDLCLRTLNQWQGAAPTSAAQIRSREVLGKS